MKKPCDEEAKYNRNMIQSIVIINRKIMKSNVDNEEENILKKRKESDEEEEEEEESEKLMA